MHPIHSPIVRLSTKTDPEADRAAFARDVDAGLSQRKKKLSSRYFYDAEGSRIFQQIMQLPEYYLTRAEYRVLEAHKQTMAENFAGPGDFHLIDLGAGDALKTKLLLQELLAQGAPFDYVPVDISGSAMEELAESLQDQMPELQVHAVVGEYSQALAWLRQNKKARKVVLFLGSNIGNFEEAAGIDFLKQIRNSLNPGDQLLLGIDLRKDPATILKAYDDAQGVTAAFNLNLLHRINRELGGNIDVGQFRHHATYDPQAGVMKSFLVSEKAQELYLQATGRTYQFEAWEAIHTENSHKYTLNQVQEMGYNCGFEIRSVFEDTQRYFADVLFEAS